MKKVLIAMPNYSKTCVSGWRLLQEYGCEIAEIPFERDYTQEELKEIVGPFHGVIADSEPWCEETLAAAKNLLVIARFGTGMDSVDIEAAKRHHVIVTNCPGLNANTVAEQAVALLLAAGRQTPVLDQKTRQGEWPRTIFHEISEKTVGILGFGNIGQKLAEKLFGFGCNLLAYVPYPNEKAAEQRRVKLVSYEELIQRSDYISIHLPLLPETRHSIDRTFFQSVKKSAIIVNTARGPLVDEQALLWALTHGEISGYACDVFESEPPDPASPLFQCENYIATPHIAGETYENRERTGLATANALIDVFEGREPPNRRA